MAKQLFANNAKGKLNAGITNVAAALTLQAGQGALFPTIAGGSGDWFQVTLIDNAGNKEIVRTTTHTAANDTFGVIVRNQEGTAARAFSVNDRCELRWTQGSAEWLRDNLLAPSGTRMSFQQTAAPTLWTKEAAAAYNDAAPRFTTGVVGTGGADAFSACFGVGRKVAGHVLTQLETPLKDHGHGVTDPGHGHPGSTANVPFEPAETASISGGGVGNGNTLIALNIAPGVTNVTVQNTANNAANAHDHDLQNFNIKFVDSIVAQKD